MANSIRSTRFCASMRARLACTLVWLASLGALSTGCASLPPSELDLRQAEIVMDPAPPVLSTGGHSGKLAAAGSGAAKGGGTGILVGTVGCMGTGIFFPLCIGAVVPATTAIGAVAWGTASAVTSEGAEAVDAKQALLKSTFEALPSPALLTTHLQSAALDRLGIDLPVTAATRSAAKDASTDTVHKPWQIELALTAIACEDNKPGQPFALRVEGRARLRHGGQPDVVYERRLVRKSDVELTTTQWGADDAAAARAGFDQALRRLAEDLLIDLSMRPSAAPR